MVARLEGSEKPAEDRYDLSVRRPTICRQPNTELANIDGGAPSGQVFLESADETAGAKFHREPCTLRLSTGFAAPVARAS
jgi:hypothetical protein